MKVEATEMQEHGVEGRHGEKSHVGKEVWSCAYYAGEHRIGPEGVRNSVEKLMSINP